MLIEVVSAGFSSSISIASGSSEKELEGETSSEKELEGETSSEPVQKSSLGLDLSAMLILLTFLGGISSYLRFLLYNFPEQLATRGTLPDQTRIYPIILLWRKDTLFNEIVIGSIK
ncbi:MAG: hypothetical protein K940chlam1_00146 [Candidatus Anoxychlamydiales bacterium]|nr:hypothetical protein [Candidatus Anoxychlamydiales bacterium]NGX35629.1 hypothetical protein [Candidatus Anoxychlamydiales bacterium]